jgi:hypothetical protein
MHDAPRAASQAQRNLVFGRSDMAGVQGVKERLHFPIYDSFMVEPRKQLRDAEASSVLKFFVDARGKTKLESNVSLFADFDRYEVRSVRVVISDLPPQFPVEPSIADTGLAVTDRRRVRLDGEGRPELVRSKRAAGRFERNAATGDVELSLQQVVDLLREARQTEGGFAVLAADSRAVKLKAPALDRNAIADAGGVIRFSTSKLEGYLADESFVKDSNRPLREQILPGGLAGSLVGKLVYNTVTTLFVADKIRLQVPTWFFPGGAGPRSDTASVTTHGEPSPAATFRLDEPIFIDKQQNFRVEIEAPHAEFSREMQRIYGPMFIWVVLDGYVTRDVQ